MYYYSPISSKRFYLQLLLTKVRRVTLYKFLFIVNDTTYLSYHTAYIARGLVEDD
jgi:hypothetical protein